MAQDKKKSSTGKQVRGTEQREQAIESQEQGEAYRESHQGADLVDHSVRRSNTSSDHAKK